MYISHITHLTLLTMLIFLDVQNKLIFMGKISQKNKVLFYSVYGLY